MRIDVAPALLEWASERSGRDLAELGERFPKLEQWAGGDASMALDVVELEIDAYRALGYELAEGA